MKYQIKCAEPEQHSMFYSDCEPALRNACVGHLRMDFGSGSEFYSSWWDNRSDLNTAPFRSELDEVVNGLRKDGLLKNRSEMHRYCTAHQSLNLNESYGFSVETDDTFFSFDVAPSAAIMTAIATATISGNCSSRSHRSRMKRCLRVCHYEQKKS